MRKLAFAFALMASPALADPCTDRGFQQGTMPYLECWRYVTGTVQRNQARDDANWQSNMDLFQRSIQPQQPNPWLYTPNSGWCRNQWGQQVVCR